MELVEGEDLARRLGRGRLPVREALAIALQIAEAVEAAHDRGIVHSDLKASNVMVDEDGGARARLRARYGAGYGPMIAAAASPSARSRDTVGPSGPDAPSGIGGGPCSAFSRSSRQ